MTTTPTDYQESRQQFRDYLPVIHKTWPRAHLHQYELQVDRDLSIDWLRADAHKHRQNLLVISTGLHGIEGYIGSAVIQLFINEFLPRILSETTGILLIHSLNPWGMKHWKRINPNNVDLNRNFISGGFSSPELINRDYPRLLTFLCPERPLRNLTAEKAGFAAGLLMTILRLGTSRLREAVLMGQYDYPTGIYYGGQSIQEETGILMKLYQEAFRGYRRIVHLDLHSGYGPRDQMTVVTSPLDERDAQAIKHHYHLDRVAGANPDEFYSMHGDMNDWEYELVRNKFTGASIFAANFEFGTYGNSFLAEARSLRINILKNQKNQFGGSPKAGTWVDREYRELYFPDEPAWFDKVQLDSRQAFSGILATEKIILS
jgi:hypothetical protein